MILKLTNIQIFTNFIWLFLFALSTYFLINSSYILPSSILYALTLFIIIVGFLHTNYNKNLYLFSPLLLIIYNAFFYISFQGLYCFSNLNNIPLFTLPTKNESILAEICIIYTVFVLSILLPYLLSLFSKKRFVIKLKIFSKNFDYKTLTIYLILSQIILFILLIGILITTGYNPYSALMNGLMFRYAYRHGLANYLYTFFYSIISLNNIIVLKYIFINELKTKTLNLLSTIYILFYLFWFLISGSRGFLLSIVIVAIYIYASKKNIKINLYKIAIVLASVLLTLIILAFYQIYRNLALDVSKGNISGTAQQADIIQTTLERADAFAIGVVYFNDVKNKYDNFITYPEIKIRQQLFYQLATIIPRKILPEKGISVHAELTKQLYPVVYNNDVGFIFGGVVDLFFAGGIFYLIFDALMFGFLMLLLQKNCSRYLDYDFFFINYINIYMNYVSTYFSIGLLNTDMSTLFPLRVLISLSITYILTKRLRINLIGSNK